MHVANEMRRAAELLECRRTVAGIGMGLMNYAEAHDGYLPEGAVPNDRLPIDERLSWVLGPSQFMFCWHCAGLDSDIDWDGSNRQPKVAALGRVPMTFLSCPAAAVGEGQSALHRPDPASLTRPVPLPFVGISGLGADAADLPAGHERAGVFGYQRRTRLDDIRDGRSTTLMVVETSDLRGGWADGGAATVRGIERAKRPHIGRNRPFGGNHREGAMALFADGSVRCVRPTIAPAVFEAMSTIGGGEAVSSLDIPVFQELEDPR
jgi:prepilin-type processing-associated H-X9-DG protein